MPIYKVTTSSPSGDAQDRIVDAKTKAQAINHVTRGGVEAKVLTASEVVKFIQAGKEVETASAETPEQTEAAQPAESTVGEGSGGI